MTSCRTCGADIRWLRLAKSGKAIPIDPNPNPEGTLIIKDGMGHTAPEDHKGPRYMTHFATCPDAKYHRRHR